MELRGISATVSWPCASLTESLVRRALDNLGLQSPSSSPPESWSRLLQWSTYDDIDHGLTHANRDTVLSSSYIIRKALIRKHFLSRCLTAYITKHDSALKNAIPRTWDLDIAFADELGEMWSDELWDLAQEIDDPNKWWILKPGMADRGMGIRLFNSKRGLQQIFDKFEEDFDDTDEHGTGEGEPTAIITSQLRHFVIQEYLSSPLLLDPAQIPINGGTHIMAPTGHKFHLRAYCVASGTFTLYLYSRVLALFSSVPYVLPTAEQKVDLAPHLTNTCLQTHRGEEGVRLLQELIGSDILSSRNPCERSQLTSSDITHVMDQMAHVLSETFKAAIESPVHFQPLPNAFELYGVDFLVTHVEVDAASSSSSTKLQVKLLEINAEPAIELTGPRLTWILEDLFIAIGNVCVEPFFDRAQDREGGMAVWDIGQTRFGLRKCLEVAMERSA